MMWKESLDKLKRKCTLNGPATGDQIKAAESALGVELPEDLRDLLGESNGIAGKYGEGLLWKAEQIAETNLTFRTNADFRELYMPFDHLLFFGASGDGDQFGFPIHADGLIHKDDVFVWGHDDDSRTWVAPSLKIYLERAVAGKIKR